MTLVVMKEETRINFMGPLTRCYQHLHYQALCSSSAWHLNVIRPHKSASFNTVKRAKISILCIVFFTIVYSIPHIFVTSVNGIICLVYFNGRKSLLGKLYYWTDQVFGFGFPFISLLIMNSVIIHTLRKRSNLLIIKTWCSRSRQRWV